MPEKTHVDLRVQRTYKMLSEAFVQLLHQKPYDKITVQEICDVAMIRRTTFYQHFEDKADFLRWFMREKQKEFIEKAPRGTAPENLSHYYAYSVRHILHYIEENRDLVSLFMEQDMQQSAVLDGFARLFVQDITVHLHNHPLAGNTLPPSFVAEFYIGALMAAIKWWITQGKEHSADELERFVTAMVDEYPSGNAR